MGSRVRDPIKIILGELEPEIIWTRRGIAACKCMPEAEYDAPVVEYLESRLKWVTAERAKWMARLGNPEQTTEQGNKGKCSDVEQSK